MQINIISRLKKNTFDLLEQYAQENKVGEGSHILNYESRYKRFVMWESLKYILWSFATNNDIDFGEIIIK